MTASDSEPKRPTPQGKSDAAADAESFVPHLGWLHHDPDEELLTLLNQGWFEYREMAFLWLYLRDGDVMIDCGAHIGLYSRLASRILRAKGRIIALEPNPEVLGYLKRNLAESDATTVEIRQLALYREAGEMDLYVGRQGRSGYSSLVNSGVSDSHVTVPVITLDSLLEESGLARVDFMKIDVEGAEIDVLAGAGAGIAKGALPLLQVEFTEQNLRAVGRSTEDLKRAFEAAGYRFHKLDEESLTLHPFVFDGPIWYENLYAVMGDADAINRRLAEAPAEQRRAAQDILARGRAAMALKSRAEQVDAAEDALRFAKSDLDRSGADRGRLEGLLRDQNANVEKLSARIGALEYDIAAERKKLAAEQERTDKLSARIGTLEYDIAAERERAEKLSEKLAAAESLARKRLRLLRRSHRQHRLAEDRIDNYLLRRWPLRLAFKHGIARPPLWAKAEHRAMERDSLVEDHLAAYPLPSKPAVTATSDSEARPPLSAILCTYNPRNDLLNWAMQSIAQQSLERSRFEVILVDNNSSPAVTPDDFPAAQDLPVKILRETKQGLVFARLAGIRESRGELIVFVDDDNFLAPDYFAKALEIAEKEPEIGIFGGISYASLEAEVSGLKKKLLPNLGVRDYGDAPITSFEEHWGEWEPIGAGMVTRRDVAEAFVDFVEQESVAGDLGRKGNNLMSCEDSLFARIANRLGYANSYQPALSLRHYMKKERLTYSYFWRLIKGLGRSHVRLEQALGRADDLEQIPLGKLLPLLTYRLGQDGVAGAIRWAWDLGFREEMKKLDAEKRDS